MLPIYGALHIVPMLHFKCKAVAHAPTPMILQGSWGTMRSTMFLGMFIAIYQGVVEPSSSSLSTVVLPWLIFNKGYFCTSQHVHHALVGRLHIPTWLLAALISKPSFWLGGLLSGISVLNEPSHTHQ